MSDQTQPNNNQQMIVIALVVIAVLLAAIAGFMVINAQKAANLPEPTQQQATPAAQAPAGMGGATQGGTPVAFDPKTATKVPSGMSPEEALKAYNEDILAGKYAEAYKLLPLDKQQSYGSAADYETQLKAYGITSYELGKPVVNGDEVQIQSTQVTPQMPIGYTWTFAKVNGTWYVKSRAMGGQ